MFSATPNDRVWVNTDMTKTTKAFVRMELDIELTPGTNLSAGEGPFDVYLFNTDLGTEVHRPAYSPISSAAAAKLGTADDGSTATRKYVTKSGVPFVLDLPVLANYPKEGEALDKVYPGIVAFGASSGQASQDF